MPLEDVKSVKMFLLAH